MDDEVQVQVQPKKADKGPVIGVPSVPRGPCFLKRKSLNSPKSPFPKASLLLPDQALEACSCSRHAILSMRYPGRSQCLDNLNNAMPPKIRQCASLLVSPVNSVPPQPPNCHCESFHWALDSTSNARNASTSTSSTKNDNISTPPTFRLLGPSNACESLVKIPGPSVVFDLLILQKWIS